MRIDRRVTFVLLAMLGCSKPSGNPTTTSAGNEPVPPSAPANEAACHLVEDGFGPDGSARVRAQVVAEGLEVPWSIAFLPGSRDMLVTERPGRIRLVRRGALAPQPVATVAVTSEAEGGLLGLVLHPEFAQNRAFYVYYTAKKGDRTVNRVARWMLDDPQANAPRAREDRIVFDDIPAAQFHDGGRMRFGGDGMLYVGTGDARTPELSQDWASPAGKLLRLTDTGAIPPDNPRPGSPALLVGIRNLQAFDWLDDGRLVLADHGPSGEMGRRGHDEVSVASSGQNLGWPGTWSCERKRDVVTPRLVFAEATPPGGATFYRGDAIPEWTNSFLFATLESRHLHRVVLDREGRRVTKHEVYFRGERPRGFGRLRDAVTGPDGAVYVTTSNCDGRGECPPSKDAVLRVTSEDR